jgi:hypothetical protein
MAKSITLFEREGPFAIPVIAKGLCYFAVRPDYSTLNRRFSKILIAIVYILLFKACSMTHTTPISLSKFENCVISAKSLPNGAKFAECHKYLLCTEYFDVGITIAASRAPKPHADAFQLALLDGAISISSLLYGVLSSTIPS